MTAVTDEQQRRLVDELLVPDPRPEPAAGDVWYRHVTTEKALRAAERRHVADLERRYVNSRAWADYSVDDYRLPMTVRQTHAAAAALFVSVAVSLIGVIVGSTVVTVLPVLVSAPVVVLVVRDVYRRVMLWLLER